MSGLCPRLTGSGLICASALAAGLLFLAGARARALAEPDDDLLEHVRRTEQVAAQKLETELRATLRDGAKLAKTDPALALERYRQALAELENDAVLPAGQRESLKRVFKDRIRTTKLELARASDKETRVTPSMIRRAEEARQAALRDEIGKTLRLIQSLQRDGKTAEANRLAEELETIAYERLLASASRNVRQPGGSDFDETVSDVVAEFGEEAKELVTTGGRS